MFTEIRIENWRLHVGEFINNMYNNAEENVKRIKEIF